MFNNRPNKAYKTKDGIIYHSRSVALVGYICCIYNNEIYMLIGERSHKMDNPGKLNMPCGYLDWDETLVEAFRREIFEETGFDINSITSGIYKKDDQPFLITSNLEAKQNVTLHYSFIFKSDILPKIKPDFESNWVKWIKIEDLIDMDQNRFAFNHYLRISDFLTTFESVFK